MLPHQTPQLQEVRQQLPLLLHPAHLVVPVILLAPPSVLLLLLLSHALDDICLEVGRSGVGAVELSDATLVLCESKGQTPPCAVGLGCSLVDVKIPRPSSAPKAEMSPARAIDWALCEVLLYESARGLQVPLHHHSLIFSAALSKFNGRADSRYECKQTA